MTGYISMPLHEFCVHSHLALVCLFNIIRCLRGRLPKTGGREREGSALANVTWNIHGNMGHSFYLAVVVG